MYFKLWKRIFANLERYTQRSYRSGVRTRYFWKRKASEFSPHVPYLKKLLQQNGAVGQQKGRHDFQGGLGPGVPGWGLRGGPGSGQSRPQQEDSGLEEKGHLEKSSPDRLLYYLTHVADSTEKALKMYLKRLCNR